MVEERLMPGYLVSDDFTSSLGYFTDFLVVIRA